MPRCHVRYAEWIRRMMPICGDASLARRELGWMLEKITSNSSQSHMNVKQLNQLNRMVTERVQKHKPLQYILGTQPFCDLDIVTRPPVLIPRWETEEWTLKLIERLRSCLAKDIPKPLRILDACTGTGCIALALAAHLPPKSVDIVAIDISPTAVALARHNRHTLRTRLQNPVKVVQADICSLPPPTSQLDLIVANPPYVTHSEYADLGPDVKAWEDKRALVAEDEGTAVHKHLVELASRATRANESLPRLVMEIGGSHQVLPITRELESRGFRHIHVWQDLAHRDRVIVAT